MVNWRTEFQQLVVYLFYIFYFFYFFCASIMLIVSCIFVLSRLSMMLTFLRYYMIGIFVFLDTVSMELPLFYYWGIVSVFTTLVFLLIIINLVLSIIKVVLFMVDIVKWGVIFILMMWYNYINRNRAQISIHYRHASFFILLLQSGKKRATSAKTVSIVFTN